jgi:hypothetical protein
MKLMVRLKDQLMAYREDAFNHMFINHVKMRKIVIFDYSKEIKGG